ncbi:hypothetical protein HZH66_015386 [Vespula vulgaris]|uniref:Uncharacterized protein n=1 Tax=Vespula vulgaris TaxID=7454 RepID=A0A834J0W6_VESVU|nr:hypothetical protein HZH66_015386 [Vespula vulgaris]
MLSSCGLMCTSAQQMWKGKSGLCCPGPKEEDEDEEDEEEEEEEDDDEDDEGEKKRKRERERERGHQEKRYELEQNIGVKEEIRAIKLRCGGTCHGPHEK